MCVLLCVVVGVSYWCHVLFAVGRVVIVVVAVARCYYYSCWCVVRLALVVGVACCLSLVL